MPAAETDTPHDLNDFTGFLELLQGGAGDFVVIGGCAVCAYARLRGKEIFSRDLDLFTDDRGMLDVLERAPAMGVRVIKTPRPRNIQVAVLEWEGKEVNVLTESRNMPDLDSLLRFSREFVLRGEGAELEVLVADPYDLLANKLAVNRPKDQPHIEVLKAFIEEEAVEAFRAESVPRKRIEPAKRYLKALGADRMQAALGRRLLPLARTPTDLRFLAQALDAEEAALLPPLAADAALREELAAIVARRRAPATRRR